MNAAVTPNRSERDVTNHSTAATLERLERRTLLVHFGIDPDFGELGSAPVGGMLAAVAGGKILAVSQGAVVRLSPDGSVDSTFVDQGAAPQVQSPSGAVISGQRLIIAGRAGGSDEIFIRAINLQTGAVDPTFGTGGIL